MSDANGLPVNLPPHSVEAEQSVLGALLIDNRAWPGVAGLLQPQHFYLRDHQLIYAAIGAELATGRPADVITVFEAMQRAGVDERAGGMPYLNSLAQSVPSASNIARYAQIVVDRSRARQAIGVAQDLIGRAMAGDAPEQAIDGAVAALLKLARGQTEQVPVALPDLFPDWLDQLEQRAQGRFDAIPTGLADCDALFCGGLERGDLVVIGSRPSMGKTALAHALTRNMARTAPVLVLSMEDSLRMLINRQVAAMGRVNLADLRNPSRAAGPMWVGVTDGIGRLSKLPVYVDDQPALSVADVRRKAMHVQQRKGDLGVVILDYLQLMDEPSRGDEIRAYELNRIVRGLKTAAKQLHCVVVLLSQLSRKADEANGPPSLHHLAESGGIEQAADIIGLLWRKGRHNPSPDFKHHAQIEWAKNKNGRTDTVQLWFDGATQRMEDAAQLTT